MIALGCSNFFGSFFKIHVICCALSVTLAVDGAGGKSQVRPLAPAAPPCPRDAHPLTTPSKQVASLCVSLVVMVTMLVLGSYLYPLPKVRLKTTKICGAFPLAQCTGVPLSHWQPCSPCFQGRVRGVFLLTPFSTWGP